MIFGIRTFRTYLLGRHFKVITDHSALKWLDRIHLKGRLERWVMELQEFQFSVEHKPGKLHSNADALSRLIVHDQSSEGPHKEVETFFLAQYAEICGKLYSPMRCMHPKEITGVIQHGQRPSAKHRS